MLHGLSIPHGWLVQPVRAYEEISVSWPHIGPPHIRHTHSMPFTAETLIDTSVGK